jgi:hypothetical protein
LKSREKESQHRESVFEQLIPPVARTDDFDCPTRTSEEATDGNLREALCTFPGFCISLFRPYRHPGVLAPAVPTRTHRAFFRDLHGQYPITPQVLAKRTPEYRGWVEAYAHNHKIPMLKAEKGVSKEKCVLPHLQRIERRNQHGVYCIFTSMEMGSTFQSRMPQFPTDDPDYRIIRRGPSRYLHYYFYIRDPVIGPLSMCIGTYLPFQTTYYLNGHNFMEIELRRQGVVFRKDDNAFLSISD